MRKDPKPATKTVAKRVPKAAPTSAPKTAVRGTHAQTGPRKANVPVVGIGASAGGLEAFRAFLEALPAKTGMAYVFVQHLDPDHESMLSELLARVTAIPVVEVKQRTLIQPNYVYVISPGKNMAFDGSALTLSARSKKSGIRNMPIDHLFRSLADACGEEAIGVVLSGTASDGTVGLRAIKEAGGLTFVQNSTAKYQGMPQSAIAAGVADYVLPAEGIAKELVAVSMHPLRKSGTVRKGDEGVESDPAFQKVLGELLRATGVDFTHYKVSTITRRITRRTLVNNFSTLEDYSNFLRGNNNEAEALFNDILINVTGFFRDPAALTCVRHKVLGADFRTLTAKEPLRAWVAGCSTGEEVYSFAMTLLEHFDGQEAARYIQIFGTDLSTRAIEKARRGVYSRSDVSGVAPRRLERFFQKQNGVYQIRKEVRDLCVFSVHDLLKDPAFSRMDIVSCCNVLIYMDTTLHRRLFAAFHYALASHGVLILGKAESVGTSAGLFTQIEKQSKVFLRKELYEQPSPRDVARGNMGKELAPLASKKHVARASEQTVQAEADAILLGHFVPASVLINGEFEILQFRGDTQAYLKHRSGKATLNLLNIVYEELAFELRDAILSAKREGAPVRKELTYRKRSRAQTVVFEVLPLRLRSGDAHFLVVLGIYKEPAEDAAAHASGTHIPMPDAIHAARQIEQLERELTHARDSARSFAEEQDAAVEELQAANEEVLSSNEELQSINEELETSTEELESTNEELHTVNQELQTRNEELTESRDYAESIIATMRNPLLVLDKDLRVQTANHAFYRTFRTTKEETEGNFLYDLGSGQWDIRELRVLLHEVLPQNNVVYDYEIACAFPRIGARVFHLNAHIIDHKGHRRLILLAFEDVTEEQALSKQKDEFIGIASHEIKTPITSIKTFTELLQKKLTGSSKKEYGRIVEHISMQSDRLTTLVTDLLSFSQMQAGKFDLRREPCDLDALVARTVAVTQQSASQHSIIKEGKLKANVALDAGRIEQVLINLLTNAVKYSPEGKQIVVRTEAHKGEVQVSVQDFGEGIPKKDHTAIFARFHRGTDAELYEQHGADQGFGLGLYISAEIIRKHEGKLWVESKQGKGSTFFFTLPTP